MSFSYDETLPTAKDRIRHMLGDTAAPGLRSDETIQALLVSTSEVETTAILAEGLAVEYAQQPDSVSIPGGPTVSFRSLISTWLDVAKRARASIEETVVAGVSMTITPKRYDIPDPPSGEYTREWPSIYYPSPDTWFTKDEW